MPKPPPRITLFPGDKEALESWANLLTMSHSLVERAKMVLLSSYGLAVKEIAAKLLTYPKKVIQ